MSFLPKIIEISDEIIEVLIEDKFFVDFEIQDMTYAKKRFCEELTSKFVNGELDEDGDIFTDTEYDIFLNVIVDEYVLSVFHKEGYFNSYEDENTEEVFFLTEEGKKNLDKLDDNDETQK
jgi:hypothetical protein